MKKTVTLLLAIVLLCSFAACSSSRPDPAKSYRISGGTEEDGVVYYSVYVYESFKWDSAGYYEQADLAKSAIEACRAKAAQGGYSRFEVIGYTETGANAFYWSQPDTVKLYVDGKYEDDYKL